VCGFAAAVVLAAGCAKAPPPLVPVGGVVRLDGKPLKHVLVRFIPKDDHGRDYLASGVTDDAGRFQLACAGKPGACAGENRVLVAEGPLPEHLVNDQAGLARYYDTLSGRPLPARYASLINSPLTAQVQAGQTEYDLDLSR
jgi:hypothetical protein